jgi:hypothetical protein
MLGSITLNGSEAEVDDAHVRWFITSDVARGAGHEARASGAV